MMAVIMPRLVLLKELAKESLSVVILILAIFGISMVFYLTGQAYTQNKIDAYFEDRCGDVPRYHKVGDGISSYYVETKLDNACIETDEPQLWVIPKE